MPPGADVVAGALAADPHDLQRFVTAQADCFDDALAELQAGRKRTHWMWFVFPQLRGLGISPTSRRYAIAGRAEALAYLAHPLLGERLRRCTEAVLAQPERSLSQIFGWPDEMKFASSMTLFEAVGSDPMFTQAIARCCGGQRDAKTLALLALADS